MSNPKDQAPQTAAAIQPSTPVTRKYATRRDKVEEKPQAVSLSPSLEMHWNEFCFLLLQECNPTINVGSIYYLRELGQVKVFPAAAGADGATPLALGPGGRTADCAGGLGFRKREIPLLSKGTVQLGVTKQTEPDGVQCLVVHLKPATLAKEVNATANGGKSKGKGKADAKGKKGKKETQTKPGEQASDNGSAKTE